jgi:glycosyltransferase involved in cell wall biosynthesis
MPAQTGARSLGGPFRVCLVLDHLGLGGAQRSAVNFALRVDPERFAITVCALGRVSPLVATLAERGIDVVALDAARWNPFLTNKLRRIATSSGAQLLYLRLSKALFVGTNVARQTGLPFVYHESIDQSRKDLGQVIPTRIGANLALLYKRFCVRQAAATIACAHTAGEDLLRMGIVPEDRLHIVPNGIDLGGFRCDPAERALIRGRLRREFGFPDHAVVVINAGRFVEQKNWPAFLRGVLAARNVSTAVYGLAVGDGPLLARSRAAADNLGLRDVVRFPGFRGDVRDVMAASDVLLFPSVREGDPNTVKEAMASGLPVIGFSAGDAARVVQFDEHGYVFPIGQEAALQQMLCKVVIDRHLRSRLSRSAQMRALAEFGVERTVQRIERVLAQALKQHEAAGSLS